MAAGWSSNSQWRAAYAHRSRWLLFSPPLDTQGYDDLEDGVDCHWWELAQAEALSCESGQQVGNPVHLIVSMLQRFIATDRGFARLRKVGPSFPPARSPHRADQVP
ncbi:DUF2274 domain-containing protein [Bosea thiooxidans]